MKRRSCAPLAALLLAALPLLSPAAHAQTASAAAEVEVRTLEDRWIDALVRRLLPERGQPGSSPTAASEGANR